MPQNKKRTLTDLRYELLEKVDAECCPSCKTTKERDFHIIQGKLYDKIYSLVKTCIKGFGGFNKKDPILQDIIMDQGLKGPIDKAIFDFQMKVHKDSYKVGFVDGKIDVLNSLEISPENYDLSKELRCFKK
jgi:hypothetical protein